MGRVLKVLVLLSAAVAFLYAAGEKPEAGIKTPGVQIPFAKLKAEAEFQGSPHWLLFADSVLMPAESGEALARIDAKANKPGEFINGFSEPCAGAINAFKTVWVPNCGAKTIARVDAKSGEIKATIAAGAASVHGGITASSDSVWVLTDTKATLSRIDPDTNMVVGELRVPAGCAHTLFAESSLWLICPEQNWLMRVNPATNLIDQRIDVAKMPGAVASGEGSLWVLGLQEGKINRIDPKTNKIITTIELKISGDSGSMAFGEGNLWVSMPGFPLTRIDTTAEKERVVQQFYGEGGGTLFIGSGSLWLSREADATLWRLDPKRVFATLAE